MSSLTSAELAALKDFANKTHDRANLIESEFRRWHGDAMGKAEGWKGHGGNTNVTVVSALEEAHKRVTRLLRDCGDKAHEAHTRYTGGDQHQGDTLQQAANHITSITTGLV
jgi:uncharacterized protein YukE